MNGFRPHGNTKDIAFLINVKDTQKSDFIITYFSILQIFLYMPTFHNINENLNEDFFLI